MKKSLHIIWLAAVTILLAAPAAGRSRTSVQALKCERLENPVGITAAAPRLSWEIVSDRRGVEQTAYRILVASSERLLDAGTGDKWDSGWVISDETIGIPYAGTALHSDETCFWKVQVKSGRKRSPWSPTARWTTGFTSDTMWQARWIGLDRALDGECTEGETRLAARYLRKEFALHGQVRRALLHICGLGLYEAYVNGQRIGDQVLAPTPTDYDKSVRYNVFDITDRLSAGDNALGVILGNGRYFSMRNPGCRHFGFPKLLLQLEIEYADGSRQRIVSDTLWRVTADGPIRANNEYDGEEYDARREMPGWDRAGYADASWSPAEEVKAPAGRLEAQTNPNIRIMERIRPKGITRLTDSTYLLDMGQNMVGWLAMRVAGEAGDTVKLRFAETLRPDGTLYLDNLRSARATDRYIPDGGEKRWWRPSFTYHGFRYVEITGCADEPTLDDFLGEVIYDRMETTGRFECSDSMLCRIHRNAYWGIRGNYRGMPTDCPQRDERMGWLGDRATGAAGESFLFDNQLLYAKWLQDIEQTQLPDGRISDVAPNYWVLYNGDVTWPSAYFLIAGMLYDRFGDIEPIRRHYASMKRWMEQIRQGMSDGLVVQDTYGDWCMPPESPELIHSQDPARRTDGALLSTATYYKLLQVMERFAQLAGHPEEMAGYRALADEIRTAYNRRFYNAAEGSYANNTVTANLLSLVCGLVPAECETKVFEQIVARIAADGYHVNTGLVGIRYLMQELTHRGRPDIAFRLATNPEYPGWGYMVEKGATTIWELWNGDTANPAMNSGNHVMLLGDLLLWYYEDLAGIANAPGSIAYRELAMRPRPVEGLDRVDASFRSPRGTIRSAWSKHDGVFEWTVTLPANTRATLWLPTDDPASIREGGRAVARNRDIRILDTENGWTRCEVGSGTYDFQARFTPMSIQ